MAEEKVSDEQAEEALQLLLNPDEEQPEPAPIAEETVEAVPGGEQEPTEPVAAAEGEPEEEGDDLALLKKRNEDLESQVKEEKERFDSKLRAIQERTTANQRILRDQYLRKSTATDKALKILEATRTEAGVAEGDVDRLIEEMKGTMHPSSPSYVAPLQRPAGLTEEQEIIANDFFTEKGMTQDEVVDFVKWYQADGADQLSPTENAVALRDLDAFMRIAHPRWEQGMKGEGKKLKTDDAVGAVKSVQRTQREAAKAASIPTTAPKKRPVGSTKEIDFSKVTPEQVSAWARQSVEQYK